MRGSLLLLCLCCLCLCAPPARAQGPAPALPTVSTPTATPEQARAQLREVLSRREFGSLRRDLYKPELQQPSWWQSFWTKVGAGAKSFFGKIGAAFSKMGKAISKFFERWRPKLGTPSDSRPKTGWLSGLGSTAKFVLIVAAVALALWLVGFIISRVMLIRRRREAPESGEQGAAAASPARARKQEPTYWERALMHAEELWQRGEEREALRVVQRACLVLLDARGLLRYDETRANGEVLRELRRQGKPGVSDALRPIVRTFDRGWYGFLPVSGEEFHDLLSSSKRFRETVIGGSA